MRLTTGPLRYISSLLLIFALTLSVLAQQAVVSRNVNLRRDPSTANAPILRLLPGDELDLIYTDWAKSLLRDGNFTSGGRVCGPTGSDTGNETNRRKNRVDVLASYHAITFDALLQLPDLRVPRDRARWEADDSEQVAQFEGVPVSVIGYMVAIKPQTTGSGESTNCKWKAYNEVDWHMALVRDRDRGRGGLRCGNYAPRQAEPQAMN